MAFHEFWSTAKYLNDYWQDLHKIQFGYSWSPEVDSWTFPHLPLGTSSSPNSSHQKYANRHNVIHFTGKIHTPQNNLFNLGCSMHFLQ